MFSGERGWDAASDADARALAQAGALVAGIDTVQMRRQFAGDGKGCVFPDGDLENLALPAGLCAAVRHAPLLVGEGGGAAIAYAMVAQADAGVFAGALTVDFTPRLDLGAGPVRGPGHPLQATPERGAVTALLPAARLRCRWRWPGPASQPAWMPGRLRRTSRGRPSCSFQPDDRAAIGQAALVAASRTLARVLVPRRPCRHRRTWPDCR